jgi:5-methylthioadenosine/S-adenosylhomocysteine deaminase
MCQFCLVAGDPPRRTPLGSIPAPGVAAAAPAAPPETSAQANAPPDLREGRRLLIRGGHVMSMDPAVGDIAGGDVLVAGARIVEVGRDIAAADAAVIDARGRIVMPGFIDTHHHQFETALRSYLADGLLFNDGRPHGSPNYLDEILGKLSKVYRPEDVYINELVGSLSQLDAGVTTVLDVSQIHHSPEHSDAAVDGLRDAGRRAVLGYFEGHGERLAHPEDARRIRSRYFSSDDQLLTMAMGGEIYIPGHERLWALGRELGLPIALHVVGSLGMANTFDDLARAGRFEPDLIFIHMTGISDFGWAAARDAGAHVSLAVPIEMTMRHGMPPLLKTLSMGLQPSLSTDVECTMTADPFTQMRAAMTLQRALVNEAALSGERRLPELLTARDVIRFATVEGAKGLRLDRKVGALTPGREADIVLLDAGALNVMPLNNVPGAVVSLMDRSNVETVLVAGRVRKWRGVLQEADLDRLRQRIEASRDHVFHAAGVERRLFG